MAPTIKALSFLALLFATSTAMSAEGAVDFDKDIRPIFVKHCFSCHGPEKQRNGYRLDVKAVALKGGDTHGVAIMPGNSAASPLIRYVSGADAELTMPPKGPRLNNEEIRRLRRWIDAGAPWRESGPTKDPALDHWSFQPLRRPVIPSDVPSTQGAASRNPIDLFIAHKLSEKGLHLSREADRRTLMRRLSFDLHGLPPTLEEVDAFVRDTDPLAYEKLVDRLLASPRYGERWARHWLDVIAFGETHGFEVNTPRDNAWPYRDYVIRALNEDKPYPDFIREQLAGDAVGEDAATGFLVARAALLAGQTGRDEESIRMARQDELNDLVLGAGSAFLGLTINCARCHDHKFDPISQADYYAIQALFAGVRHGERPLRVKDYESRKARAEEAKRELARIEGELTRYEPLADPEAHIRGTTGPLRPPVHPRFTVERFSPIIGKKIRFTVLATSSLEPCIDELEVFSADEAPRNVALASAGTKATASGTFPGAAIHQLKHINDGRYGNGRSWISNEFGKGWVELEFPKPVRIEKVVWARDREEVYSDRLPTDYRIEVETEDGARRIVASSADRRKYVVGAKAAPVAQVEGLSPGERAVVEGLLSAQKRLASRLKELNFTPVVYAGRFEAKPETTWRLHRGDPMQRREEISPAILSRVGPKLEVDPGASEQSRRLALAAWIADPRHPLTARVLVNRLWHFHFGEGIVNTPSDFGRNGARPTHPELLDWLATEFIDGGWSLKRVHRLICLSAAYRQSSQPNAKSISMDAESRLLWRFPPRRLEAEAVRDSILAVTGTLDARMGGPGFSVFKPNDNYVRVYDPREDFGPTEWRRMIYATKVRMAQDGTFGAFDCPDAGQVQPKRPRSTTPIQALNLFNSSFVHQQAELLAARLQRDRPGDLSEQIRLGFQLAFSRRPAPEEAKVCERLAAQHGLGQFCRVLFNANEFLFVN